MHLSQATSSNPIMTGARDCCLIMELYLELDLMHFYPE